jgi:hypothetical protein
VHLIFAPLGRDGQGGGDEPVHVEVCERQDFIRRMHSVEVDERDDKHARADVHVLDQPRNVVSHLHGRLLQAEKDAAAAVRVGRRSVRRARAAEVAGDGDAAVVDGANVLENGRYRLHKLLLRDTLRVDRRRRVALKLAGQNAATEVRPRLVRRRRWAVRRRHLLRVQFPLGRRARGQDGGDGGG